jgi:bisphosphoglycerate-dependent phosphoglycerate mutase
MQDLDTQQAQSLNGDNPDLDISNDSLNELEEGTSEENVLQTFLKLKEHGQSSRTKALRLKENDVIVAIDGNSYHDSIDKMVDLLSSGEEGDLWLLTIWRNGKFFEVFTRGPLGGIFEFTRPDESQMIFELFQKREMGEKEDYRIFEALRDVKRVVDVYDTTHSQVAVILPPVWLLQQKMWEPLLAILCVYLITFSVNIFLFILAVILIALYLRKGQVTLRRSYGMFQDRNAWAILAARSDKEAQEMCRGLDEKVNFINAQVKPYKNEVAKPKKINKSGNVLKAPQQYT